MDWRKEAVNDLKQHERRKAALISLSEEIRELKARIYGSTAPAANAVPVQGGSSTAEGRLIASIDEFDRKRDAYRIAKRQVDAVERGLATLTDQQREILDIFFLRRVSNHAEVLAQKYHVDPRRVYQLKEEAVANFTYARYGLLAD